MADFCRQCTQRMLGVDQSDLKGLTSEEAAREGRYAVTLCEGCGPIQVDPAGNCISKDCLVDHSTGRLRK